MSDFDKEAEREKLREKYGEEDEKRKATEQMSELLLKGATMTNAHCTDCGDPIFRYDGQEFCPTCQKPVAREQPEESADGDETQGDHIEVADPSDDATVQFGADASTDGQPESVEETPANGASDAGAADASDADTATPPAADQLTDDTTQEVPSADPGRTPESPPSDAVARGSDASASTDAMARGSDASVSTDAVATESDASASTSDRSPAQSPTRRRPSDDDPVNAELSAAESLLAETVHRFARRAADTDDPRTAREQLKTAREAAEALDAVRF